MLVYMYLFVLCMFLHVINKKYFKQIKNKENIFFIYCVLSSLVNVLQVGVSAVFESPIGHLYIFFYSKGMMALDHLYKPTI